MMIASFLYLGFAALHSRRQGDESFRDGMVRRERARRFAAASASQCPEGGGEKPLQDGVPIHFRQDRAKGGILRPGSV